MAKDLKAIYSTEKQKISNKHLSKFEMLLEKELPQKKSKTYPTWFIAASLALFIGLNGIAYYLHSQTDDTQEMYSEAEYEENIHLQLDVLEYSMDSYNDELLSLCYNQLEDLDESIAEIQSANIKDIKCSLVNHLHSRLEENSLKEKYFMNQLLY